MAFDAFLQIDGIPGESTDSEHSDWIEINSYDIGVSQSSSATASSVGGASTERADFSAFSITKQLDKSSPKLVEACADGTHISSIVLELCRAGTDKIKFMEYKLTNCIIKNVTTGGAGSGDVPSETVSFDYGKIEYTYTQQKREGGGTAGNVASGWDLEQNKKAS